jgi:hypothetical protein
MTFWLHGHDSYTGMTFVISDWIGPSFVSNLGSADSSKLYQEFLSLSD